MSEMEVVNHRILKGYKISVLCFGTATFVAGKLLPHKDSSEGMTSLKIALDRGINIIHSNSNLGTQWAIRETLNDNPQFNKIYHLIKIESPLKKNDTDLLPFFEKKVEESLHNLNVDNIFGIIYEIDVKKTNEMENLSNENVIKSNFAMVKKTFDNLKDKCLVKVLIGMTHDPLEMRCAIESKCFDSYAAYYNLTNLWPIEFFNQIQQESKNFIGIRPLNQGTLTDEQFRTNPSEYRYVLIKKLIQKSEEVNSGHLIQDIALRFVLSHPVVCCTIVGASQPSHILELINASKLPLSPETFEKIIFSLKK